MSNKGVLQMDSYRLAQYTVEVPCYICDGGNNFDSELCRHCHAPMALVHQAQTNKVAPQMVATIGTADAGKTVFLGMLTDMLTRASDDMYLLARGAFSVALQQMAISALSGCEFPNKTPSEPDRWNWIHCQVKNKERKRPVELIMPDLAGEAIVSEIDHPNTFPVIKSFLEKSASIMVLIDAWRLEQGEQDQDFFAIKMLSYLCEMNDNAKTGWPARPMAIIFSKADQSPGCFANPTEYARKHTPGLWQFTQDRLQNVKFFASGVAGACGHVVEAGGRRHVPLRIEPHGIIEPFSWLVKNLPK